MGNALPVFAPVCRYGARWPDVKVLGMSLVDMMQPSSSFRLAPEAAEPAPTDRRPEETKSALLPAAFTKHPRFVCK